MAKYQIGIKMNLLYLQQTPPPNVWQFFGKCQDFLYTVEKKKTKKKFILFKGQQQVQYNNMPSDKYLSLKTTEQRWE